jgi:hypothetical protein
MTLAKYLVFTAAALAVGSAYADTKTTNRASKAEVERKASPAAPKTDEERTQTHSQPDVPHPTEPSGADKTAAFKSLDVDGDGLVSKAEAAGHEEVTLAFDRADRNRDGKLTVAEYERHGKAKAKAKAKAKTKTKTAARKSDGSASAGGTKPGAKEKP